MEVFVTKALKKIRKETSRKHKALRDSCDKVLATLAKSAARQSSSAAHDTNADKYFEPFRLACESKKSEIMETALYCLHNLIAYGYLRGGESVGEGRRLIDVIVETVCSCNDHTDHGVQLQVIKALLTAVTSSTCEVHETSLLSAVRACYHIHLVSDSLVNKTTAKATLTQMLNVVFQRMETFDQRVRAQRRMHHGEDDCDDPAGGTSAGQGNEATAAATDDEAKVHEKQEEAAGQAAGEEAVDIEAAIERPARLRCAFGVGEISEQRDDGVVVVQLPYGVLYLSAADAQAAERLPPSTGGAVSSTGAAVGDDPNGGTAVTAQRSPPAPPSQAFVSVLHKDAFLLFRALCKLSMKGLPDDPSLQPDRIALQSKILSLELLLSVLDHAGASFRASDKFIYAIRTYLCHSLIKNCTSNVTQVVGLSLRIFVALIAHFKAHLKAQIEVFISNIFLCILESPNSTFDHKTKVLEVFHNLAQDPTALVEIFLNYDCDFDSIDLFKRIVHALSKVAKGRAAADFAGNRRTEKEEVALRMLGLESLVAIVKSLGDSAQLDDDVQGNASVGANEDSGSSEASSDNTVRRRRAQTDFDEAQVDEAAAATEASEREAISAVVSSFAVKQKHKDELATAVIKFNIKPKSGVAYLVERGHMPKNSPKHVAKFLMDMQEALDKTVVGDYLGKEVQYQDGFCVKVLHEYVDMMDFTDMKFDLAIRHFLAGFRLPGEAQKIDRMMEKFAERYCSCNTHTGVFPSADTAFILAFAVVMLQTDLHNPSIKEERRMTKEGFRSQNRGIADGNDLPAEMLDGIYDRLKKTPFTLKEDDDARAKAASEEKTGVVSNFFGVGRVDPSRRAEKDFSKERGDMSRRGEALLKQVARANRSTVQAGGRGEDGSFHHLQDMQQEHVAPMFDVAWAPVLAVLSVNLETTEEEQVVTLCLDGVHLAIRIASHFRMTVVRDAFVTSLAKFTTLDTVREMQPKNVRCIQTLIRIALQDGNWLGASWAQVLTCISQLARLQMFAEGMPADETFFAGPSGGPRGNGPGSVGSKPAKKSGFFSQPSRKEIAKQVELANAEQVMSQIDALAVDRVFSSSLKLDPDAITNFVEQLCVVSLSELAPGGGSNGGGESEISASAMKDVENKLQTQGGLAGASRDLKRRLSRKKPPADGSVAYGVKGSDSSQDTQPRVFSLQKLVEVADLNMDARSRLVWNKAWHIMSLHFARVGCHRNQSIAMFAIDSLKQLSLKFLAKGELRNFQFQKLFLRPFELIMANSPSTEIRELILSCLGRIILARHQHIRSGWSALFAAFAVGSRDSSNLSLVQLSFESVDNVLRHHFTEPSVLAVFVEVVQCLLSFAGNFLSTQISIAALEHLRVCGRKLQEGGVISTHAEIAPGTGGGNAARKPSVGGESTALVPSPNADDDGFEHVDFAGVDIDCASSVGTPQRQHADDDDSSGSETEDEGTKADDQQLSGQLAGENESFMYSDCDAHLGVWWPLLTGLAALVADPRRDVSSLALSTLFDLLEGRLPPDAGTSADQRSAPNPHQFSPKLWELVFKGVLFPLFDDVRHGVSDGDDGAAGSAAASQTLNTCMHAMESMVSLFARYYTSHLRMLLPDVLRLLHSCISVPEGMDPLAPGLPEIGVRCLRQLLLSAGASFTPVVWDGVCQEIEQLFQQTAPSDLVGAETRASLGLAPLAAPTANGVSERDEVRCSFGVGVVEELRNSKSNFGGIAIRLEWGRVYAPKPAAIGVELINPAPPTPGHGAASGALPFNAAAVLTMCATQHELQAAVGEIASAHFDMLQERHCKALLEVLHTSYLTAKTFNADMPLRQALWGAGFMRSADHPEQLPNLFGQETSGLAEHLRLLFRLHSLPTDDMAVTSWDRRAFAEQRLRDLCESVLADFQEKEAKAEMLHRRAYEGAPDGFAVQLPTNAVEAREAADCLVPMVVVILEGAATFDDVSLRQNIEWLYPAMCSLMQTNSPEVRTALQTMFASRVRSLLHI